MNKNFFKRGIAVLLSLTMLLGLVVPVGAVENAPEASSARELSFTEIDSVPEFDREGRIRLDDKDTAPMYAPDETVRVSIVLDQPSTIESGFSTVEIAENPQAMSYRASLQAAQAAKEVEIESVALNGEPLDVVWNMTLAANIISANVKYGQIDAIKNVAGVKDVFVENRYEPAVTDDNLPVDPNMGTSSSQIGSAIAYAGGYTGVGSKVAIIDTGIDPDHELFQPEPFEASIKEVGGMDKLMTAADVAAVLPELNIASIEGVTAEKLYRNSKNPFAFNYVDEDFDISHDNDSEGEHGSHVTGIAAANRLVERDGKFVSSLETVKTMGVAPDAQIVTMKVFGKGGGAYDSDYMVAIEDAIVLGCDSVNLSLGSGNPGTSNDYTYADILDSLAESGTVVTMSAGNSGFWAESSLPASLYADDVSFDMVGSPGSFTNSLAVASVDNNGMTGNYLKVGDSLVFYTESSGYSNPPFTSIPGTYDFVYIDGVGTADQYAVADVEGKIALVNRGETNFSEKASYGYLFGAKAVIVVNNQSGTINMDLSDYIGDVPVVSITQKDGELFKTNPVELDEGLTGYTGKVTVATGVESSDPEISEENDYTMSSFSSWGVPGSLELKPEITAPGGNIYSVDGHIEGGQGYENMSGTSMASPQVAGMAAVLGQYIRDNDLTGKTGYSQRQLINSLLMSTAMPIYEDHLWYSVLSQGAGLADVGAATQADAVIMMHDGVNKGAKDGKVKVELGDDGQKQGVYNYSFDITNISEGQNDYILLTDMFTQLQYPGTTALGTPANYMDTTTEPIAAEVSYSVNGVELMDPASIDADVDKDADTDEFDAQAVLEYVVGNTSGAEYDLEAADADRDGDIDSFDAYVILAGLGGRITVGAGETATVNVQIVVDRDALAKYENGTYIEGYTFIKPVATQEGVIDVEYSIPIMGYYGSWTDPSMFDRVSYYEYSTGTYERLPYTGDANHDIMEFEDTSAGEEWLLSGSSYELWEGYPDRLAVNPEDILIDYYFAPIRNATVAAYIADEDGNIAFNTEPAYVDGAYYSTSGGSWDRTSTALLLGVSPAELGFESDDKLYVELVAEPEYYTQDCTDSDGNVSFADFYEISKSLGKGAKLSKTITVDGEKPVLEKAVIDDDGNLILTVSDNHYVDGVIIYTDNVEAFTHAKAEQENPGESTEVVIDAEYVELFGLANALFGNGTTNVYIAIDDYAMNTAAYVYDFENNKSDEAEPTGITLPETISVFENGTTQARVTVEPSLIDSVEVKWAIKDTDIATVDEKGVITGIKLGSTTITATAVDYPELTATADVEVVTAPSYQLNAQIYNVDGQPMWSVFDTEAPIEYAEIKPDTGFFAGGLEFYGDEIYTHNGESIFVVDSSDFTSKELFAMNTAYLFPDAAPNLWFADAFAGEPVMVGTKAGTGDIELLAPVSASVWSFSTTSLFGSVAAIAYAGFDEEGNDYYYLVNENGDMFIIYISYEGSLGYGEIGNIGIKLKGASAADGSSYASMEYDWDNSDANGEYLYLSSYTEGDDTAYLYTIVINNSGASVLGRNSFGADVWPAVALYHKLGGETEDEEAVKAAHAYRGANKAAITGEVLSVAEQTSFAANPAAIQAPEFNEVQNPVIDWNSDVQPAPEPTPEPIPVPEPNPEPIPVPDPNPANKITGSLDVVAYDVSKGDENDGAAVIDTASNTITITYSTVDLTNEDFVITYNTSNYTIANIDKLTRHIAYNLDTEGEITVADAFDKASTAPVLRVTFMFKDSNEGNVLNGRGLPNSYSTKKGQDPVPPDAEGGKNNPIQPAIRVHTHTPVPIVINESYHMYRCLTCGDTFGVVPHEFYNGECRQCGYRIPGAATLPVQPDQPSGETVDEGTVQVNTPTAAGRRVAEIEG